MSLVLIGLCLSSQGVQGQTTVFSDDFGSYTEGDTSPGDGSWSIDVSGADLGDGGFFEVRDVSGNNVFGGNDLDGGAVWETQSLDVSGFTDVNFSLDLREVGGHEDSDYADVSYSTDGGASFTTITNWNGMGDGSHTLTGDWSSATVTQSGLSGSSLVLRVTMRNSAQSEYIRLDNVEVTGEVNPVVQFTASSGSAREEDRSAVLTVEISNPDGNQVDVDVAFDGASTAGTGDFMGAFPSITATTTVTFPSSASDGDTQTITLDIADDGAVNEGGETARFVLQNVNTAGSTTIGSLSQFDLTIRDAVSDHAGPIVIAEMMPNPAAVSDGEGEYIELYNVNSFPVDVGGWKLSDSAINEATISPGVTVPARGFIVLCIEDDPAQNGGIRNCADDYADGLSLNNGGDTVLLTNDSDVIVDRVDYTNTDPWPTASGAALVFTGTTDNNDGNNWTTAARRELGYAQNQSGDLGSPGRNGTGQALQPSTEVTGAAGWRMLAAPVSGITPTDLTAVNLVQGVSGLDFSGASPNLYQWSGGTNADVDWSVPSSTDDLTSGIGGFIWYVFDTVQSGLTDTPPFTLSLPGVPRTTDVTTSSALGDGFHLLGNPYAQSFDASGLNLPGQGFQTTVQVWDPSTGSYQNVTQAADADDVISPYQSFFVERTSGGSATLTFSASGRRTDPTTLKSTDEGPAHIAFRLTGRDGDGRILTKDEALTLTARPNASTGWDVHDASKLTPLSGRYATAAFRGLRDGSARLQAVASIPSPLPEEGVELPVVLAMRGIDAVDVFTLTWPVWEHVPDGWTITLHDTVTDSTIDLRAQSSYTFALSLSKAQTVPPPRSPLQPPSQLRAKANSDTARFVLHLQASPLPVELTGFIATLAGEAAQLAWTTASETNNAGFHVEHRGPEFATFEDLAFVEGSGTTDIPQQYRFRTNALTAGRHTFRLRQVDMDGTTAYSDTVAVHVRLAQIATMNVAPHPVRHDATVTLRVRTEQNVSVALYDVLGRRVRTLHDGPVASGRGHTFQLNTSGLASGLYLLRAAGERFRATRRVTVVR